MDPDANVQEQARLRHIIRCKVCRSLNRHIGAYGRLRELRESLAEWLSRGGYQPNPVTPVRDYGNCTRRDRPALCCGTGHANT